MTKITEFPAGTAVLPADVFLFDGVNGTKKIAADILPFVLFESIPTMHARLFRGKDLGATLTATQKTNIANGSFTDLWLGDYWTIGGVKWRIADFNYWLRSGDVSFTRNHLVIVPDSSLYTAAWHSGQPTLGYAGSTIRATGLNTAKTTATAAFGTNVISHREHLTNAASNGRPQGAGWYDSTLDLMSEQMVLGYFAHSIAPSETTFSVRYANSNSQLALFAARKDFIVEATRATYWLRDMSSNGSGCGVSGYGASDTSTLTVAMGVRPAFAIG